MININNKIFYFLYGLSHRVEWFDKLIIFLAVYFPYLIIFLAIVFLLFHHEVLYSKNPFLEFKRKWKEIILVFLSSGLAWGLADFLKFIFHTPRPFVLFNNVHALFVETWYAFPSGHATFYCALAFSIYFCHKKVGYFFLVSAFLIGMARVIGGVHFPIDILGGYILGFIIPYCWRLLIII